MSSGKKISPTWTRLDTDIIHNSHIQQLMHTGGDGLTGFAVYIEGICWSAKNLTDGLLPTWYRSSIPRAQRGINALTAVGLWIEVDASMQHGLPGDPDPPLARARWLIKDYLDYGVSREEWEALVQQRRAAINARWAKQRQRNLRSIT